MSFGDPITAMPDEAVERFAEPDPPPEKADTRRSS